MKMGLEEAQGRGLGAHVLWPQNPRASISPSGAGVMAAAGVQGVWTPDSQRAWLTHPQTLMLL